MVGKLTESGIKVYVVSSFSIHAFSNSLFVPFTEKSNHLHKKSVIRR